MRRATHARTATRALRISCYLYNNEGNAMSFYRLLWRGAEMSKIELGQTISRSFLLMKQRPPLYIYIYIHCRRSPPPIFSCIPRRISPSVISHRRTSTNIPAKSSPCKKNPRISFSRNSIRFLRRVHRPESSHLFPCVPNAVTRRRRAPSEDDR